MPGDNDLALLVNTDRSQEALHFVHQLLLPTSGAHRGLDAVLNDLARAFAAPGAGFAVVVNDGAPQVQYRVPSSASCCPWSTEPDLLDRLGAAPTGLALQTAAQTSCLLTLVGQTGSPTWLLWLEAPATRTWTSAEGAALTLAGQILLRQAHSVRTDWGQALRLAARQQSLEAAAAILQRLAHEFGNIFTSVLGFTELSLGQVSPSSPLHSYLTEVARSGQQGAQMLSQLRVFSRRGPVPPGIGDVAGAIEEEIALLGATWGPAVRLCLDVPGDLPLVALDHEPLRQLLRPLLENARESLTGEGTITLTARLTELSPAACLDLFGKLTPGPCVEVAIADTGCGLSAEASRRLPGQPFFSSKPRHRGLGLSTVYGLLQTYRGGCRFEPGPERGTVVRLFLPLAAPSEGSEDRAEPSRRLSLLAVPSTPLTEPRRSSC